MVGTLLYTDVLQSGPALGKHESVARGQGLVFPSLAYFLPTLEEVKELLTFNLSTYRQSWQLRGNKTGR